MLAHQAEDYLRRDAYHCKKYCIIFGAAMQGKLMFFAGCYFYTHLSYK